MRRGGNRVEQKIDYSKALTSVMFGGNAAGEMLPPMVVYKAKFLYDGWISVALMVRFMIALILGGLTDENSGSGSRKYLFQI